VISDDGFLLLLFMTGNRESLRFPTLVSRIVMGGKVSFAPDATAAAAAATDSLTRESTTTITVRVSSFARVSAGDRQIPRRPYFSLHIEGTC